MDRVKVIWFRTGTSGRIMWTGQKLSGSEQGPVTGWCGHSKSYLAKNKDQWQDGVDRVRVIWLRKETCVWMVWTEQNLSGLEQRPVAGWCGQRKRYLAKNKAQWQDGVDSVKVI